MLYLLNENAKNKAMLIKYDINNTQDWITDVLSRFICRNNLSKMVNRSPAD